MSNEASVKDLWSVGCEHTLSAGIAAKTPDAGLVAILGVVTADAFLPGSMTALDAAVCGRPAFLLDSSRSFAKRVGLYGGNVEIVEPLALLPPTHEDACIEAAEAELRSEPASPGFRSVLYALCALPALLAPFPSLVALGTIWSMAAMKPGG